MLNNILNLDGVAVLDKKQQSNVLGGGPSPRRCNRLLRRYLDGSDRAGDTYIRICYDEDSGSWIGD